MRDRTYVKQAVLRHYRLTLLQSFFISILSFSSHFLNSSNKTKQKKKRDDSSYPKTYSPRALCAQASKIVTLFATMYLTVHAESVTGCPTTIAHTGHGLAV